MPPADHVPFLLGRTLITVRAVVHVSDAMADIAMVIDSGAARTVISPKAAARLRLNLAAPLRFEALVGIGQSPPLPVVRLDWVQVGTGVVRSVEASVFQLPPAIQADGLLGLNFLRRFRVTFDFAARVLILREPPAR